MVPVAEGSNSSTHPIESKTYTFRRGLQLPPAIGLLPTGKATDQLRRLRLETPFPQNRKCRTECGPCDPGLFRVVSDAPAGFIEDGQEPRLSSRISLERFRSPSVLVLLGTNPLLVIRLDSHAPAKTDTREWRSPAGLPAPTDPSERTLRVARCSSRLRLTSLPLSRYVSLSHFADVRLSLYFCSLETAQESLREAVVPVCKRTNRPEMVELSTVVRFRQPGPFECRTRGAPSRWLCRVHRCEVHGPGISTASGTHGPAERASQLKVPPSCREPGSPMK